MTLGDRVCFLPLAPWKLVAKGPFCALPRRGEAWQEQTYTAAQGPWAQEAEQHPLLLVEPDPRLLAVPSSPWDRA